MEGDEGGRLTSSLGVGQPMERINETVKRTTRETDEMTKETAEETAIETETTKRMTTKMLKTTRMKRTMHCLICLC